jgi:hypothetical protein
MTIFGSDVSHYDGADTRAMFSDGIAFQTHKAGGDSNDAELGAWWNLAKGYRDHVMLGAYWVLYPGSPAARAAAFVQRLDSQCPGWRDGPFILQADCEKWNGDPATVPPVAQVNAFCDALVGLMPKLRPVGYLPDWVYGDISGFRYPLWSSKYVTGSGHYRSLYPGDSSSKWASYGGGRRPAILQYSSSATIGGQTTCDANAYQGNLEELTALLAPGWVEDVTISDADAKAIAVAVKDEILTITNQTDGSGTQSTFLGQQVWNQGIYDGVDGVKRRAWQVAQHLGTATVAYASSDAARDAAISTAVDGLQTVISNLVTTIQAGGGNVDSAAILAKLDEVKAATVQAATDAVGAARKDLLDRMQAAAEAEAAALDDGQ